MVCIRTASGLVRVLHIAIQPIPQLLMHWAYIHIPIQPACRCIWIGRRIPIGYFELHYILNQTELTDVVAPRTNSPPLCVYEANTRVWSTSITAPYAKSLSFNTDVEVFSTRAVLAVPVSFVSISA
jgi:hypothetical protein